jgi:acyl-CoA thioesterase
VSAVSVDQLRRHWQERVPFNRLCGFVVSRWDDAGVRMEVDDAEALSNGIGAIHGGVVATLVDTVANAAAITIGDFAPGTQVVTVSMTVNYTGPARGHLVADAVCSGPRRRLRSVTVDVRDDRGAPVATGLVVVKVSSP